MTETQPLRVAEAKPDDVGKGVARIDHAVFGSIGIEDGDVVIIKARKETCAIAKPGYYEDVGTGRIRIDGSVRKNAGIGVDDTVTLEKADPKPVEVISLAPTQPLRIKGGEAYLSQVLDGRPVMVGDMIPINVMGRRIDLVVTSFTPQIDVGLVHQEATIKFGDEKTATKAGEKAESKVPRVIYEDIGGLGEEIKKVREMIELPLRHPELFERLGVEAPKGVLLHGPPGTGKTLLAKAVASETNANFMSIGGPEIMSKYYGESEERLRRIFGLAERNAPSIIFIDEIDSIAPKRDDVAGEVERRVVAQILSLMDGLESRGKVVVIGATNRPNALDPALRRPGRFDREISINIPDREARLEILQIHTRGMPVNDDVELEQLSEITHGYSGADISALCKEAAMGSLRRLLPEIDVEADSISVALLNKLEIMREDFLSAFREVEPSALREVLIESPNVHWDEIGGLDEPKQEIIEAVEWPLKYEMLFDHMHAIPPKGILLFGPPGTGKTLLARAVATESDANFISVKGPEFHSKWVGESEKAVRETFKKAKQSAPCIVFFDEIDAIVPTRGAGGGGSSQVTERVVSQILTELDGLEVLHNIVIIAATNRPDIIDPALLRPGRFDRKILIPPPDHKARLAIFKIHLRDKPVADDIEVEDYAERTENYTGADIASVANEAVMLAIREYILAGKPLTQDSIAAYKITVDHMERALAKVRPTPKEELEKYYTIARQFSNE